MPQAISSKPRTALCALLALVMASLVLAACGSSSSSPTASSAASTAKTSTGGAPGAPAGARGRFTAVRECLQKDGITLPQIQRKAGQRPGGGFLGGGAGPTLPKGVSRAQYEAAIKKCGGFGAGRFRGAGGGVSSPTFRAALVKFAACLRENGVKVPAPNTSGSGPIFNTKGIDTKSTQFKTAETKCSTLLRKGFRAAPGSTPGAPPAG
jgi:hypothetical protein